MLLSLHTQFNYDGNKSRLKTMGKSIAFGWYGGKYSHLDWLLPLLPPSQHFCDVFGGSAAVIINRRPSPVETYNDIHSEVVNFFRVLRDQKELLVALSSYHCDLMDELYSDWYIVEAHSKMCHSVKSARTEVLWTNYEPPKEIEWTRHQKSSQSHSKEPTLT